MITVRQIEREWEAKAYQKLFHELTAVRPESSLRLGVDESRPVVAAAMAIIRLDELSQSHVKLYSRLVKTIIAAQEADGGWADLGTTALCLRALLCGAGGGLAIERGLAYLVSLQKSDGTWPNVPIRRMPSDPYLSAIILYQLGDQPRFASAVRLGDAVRWFAENESSLDEETRTIWLRARRRCRIPASEALVPSLS